MARQTWAALAALYPDNTAGAISPADLRAGLIDTMRPHVTSSAPDASDDETLGFDVGHAWIDTSTSPSSVYECVDASTGAAVWVKVYPQDAGGSLALDDLTDVDTSGAEEGDVLALQSDVWVPEALATVARTGSYDDLSDLPTLGSAAAQDVSAFATAAQGATADAALPKLATVNSYAGNRTLDSDDSGAYVRITAAGTVTLPDGLSTGFQAVVVNATDAATVALSAATTLTLPAGFESEVQNRRAVTVIHVGSNVWEAHGALVES